MRLVPYRAGHQHGVEVELRVRSRTPASNAQINFKPAIFAVVNLFGLQADLDVDAGFGPLLFKHRGQVRAAAGVGNVHGQVQTIFVTCFSQQGAGCIHVAGGRRHIGVVIRLIQRANGAVVANGAITLLHQFEDCFAVCGQLHCLDHARIRARLTVGAQAHQVEAIGRNDDGFDAIHVLQALEQRRAHAHHQIHLSTTQRINHGPFISEENDFHVIEGRLAIHEVIQIGS